MPVFIGVAGVFFMPQSLACVYVHLVFSTKQRQVWLDDSVRAELHAYIIGILRELQSPVVQINSVPDHIHILFSLGRTLTISQAVQEIKGSSSRWIKQRFPHQADFAWQNGYGAFGVSLTEVSAVIHYIANQSEHHRVVTFQEEYRQFMLRHNLPLDERYAWD